VVPVVDLTRRHRRLERPFIEAAERILQSGTVLLGPELRALESELDGALHSAADGRNAVVGVASGASALQLTFAALGIGAGDEVIVPAFTAVPTASAVAAVGATPVPVDVDPATAALDLAATRAALTDRTRAIVVVHLYGRPVAVAPFVELGLPVVEDAAQAHGALPDVTGRAACYSFYPTKNIGGIGDGGAIVTADHALADELRLLRTHGAAEQYVHVAVSQNHRMSELEAVWLRLQLGDLASANRRRAAIAARYRSAAPHVRFHADHPDHVVHQCVIRVGDRDRVRAELSSRGVTTAVHYPLAIVDQPAYRAFAVRPCPEAQAWAAECVSLPCFPELTDDEVDAVVDALETVQQ
jgi:dTDP-3-amino-3,4,6-trideoxy-alpha-D-glucose transaminase